MDILNELPSIPLFDGAAALFILLAWFAVGWLVEHSSAERPSVQRLMTRHRREWMQNYITREPRVTDATLLGGLREGTAFFASACLIAMGGGLALMGNTAPLEQVAEDLMLSATPTVLWEIKLLLPLIMITNAFMKFVWSHRVFGYCAVMMGAVPNQPGHSDAVRRASTAAELNIEAAKAFNRGVRSVYFALGALGWFLGPTVLCLTAITTAVTIWHREFNSPSRKLLIEVNRPTEDTART